MIAEKQTDDICVVCCRTINIYAVGPCDHAVCYDCSTRLRVLCNKNECPICRTDMPQVLFTHQKITFTVPESGKPIDQKYNIVFEDESIQKAYNMLLEHHCDKCSHYFPTVEDLSRHMRLSHLMFYCNLCIENLKIFTFERKYYSRKDMATHNRVGDKDDTSHRGHPKCKYCDERYFDKDDLFRHLRREHFFCHFCDADGKFQYYFDHGMLKNHFRKRHFLCEEEDCAQGEFIAFRTELDFRAHQAVTHTKNKTKAEAKQARTLPLEFSLAPRVINTGDLSSIQNEKHNYKDSQHRKRNMEENVSRDAESHAVQSKAFNTNCDQDFPELSTNGTGNTKGLQFTNGYSNRASCLQNDITKDIKAWNPKPSSNMEHFPALPSAFSGGHNSTKYDQSKIHEVAPKSLSKIIQYNTMVSELPKHSFGQLKMKDSSSKHFSKKLQDRTNDDFPELQRISNVSSSKVSSQKPIRANDKEVLSNKNMSKGKPKRNKKASMREESKEIQIETPKKAEPFSLSQLCEELYHPLEENEKSEKFNSVNCDSKVKSESVAVSHQQEKVNFELDFPLLPTNATRCPPGFSNFNVKCLAPPPGFAKKLGEAPISLNSISSILQENTTIDAPKSVFSYQHPENFHHRDNLLVQKIDELTGNNKDLFEVFKTLSGDFRRDKISAADYYSQCSDIIGKDKFLNFFTELLCLLPDIDKQHRLLLVHNTLLREESKKQGAVAKHRSQSSLITSIEICPVCQQVIAKDDINNHKKLHKHYLSNN